ncbi:MAG: hypothetical protein Kow0090_08950 [Myxococcota bacterium]
MNKSKIFYTATCEKIERAIKDFLNKQQNFLFHRTIDSSCAIGCAIENILVDNFGILLWDLSKDYSSQFAWRAMADFVSTDEDDFYYIVDVSAHRLGAEFNIPNLTSFERVASELTEGNGIGY